MKQLLYLMILINLVISSFFIFSGNAVADEKLVRHELGEVYIDPRAIALENTPNENQFISKFKLLDYPDYEVNVPGNIVKVELQNLKNELIKPLPDKGNNKYGLSIEGKELEAKRKIDIPQGYYEWFRDPNKVVWMYDFDGRHFLSTRPNIESTPPNGICKKADGPYDNQETQQEVPKCNVARDYREGTLWTNTLQIADLEDRPINIKDVDGLTFDKEFTFIKNGNLTRANISDEIVTKDIDPYTLHYRYDYEATYDAPFDRKVKDETNPDGLVLRWNNQWEMNIKGKVYQYSKMKIVAYTDDTPPPEKPDLTVTSLISKNVCIAVGQSTPFEYTIKNLGVSTSKSFTVSIRIDGVEYKSDVYNGLASNQSKTGTFNYTFSSEVDRQFTIFVNSDNGVDDEEKTDNNTLTETFTAKAAGKCDAPPPPDLKITGDFRLNKPILNFKDYVTLIPENISVTGGSNCTYVSHYFWFNQGGKFYVPGTNSYLSPEDKNYYYEYDNIAKVYPGGIGKGMVKVYMKINTSCGVTKEVGPKTFEIITDPKNHPPELEIAWYRSSTGQEVEKVSKDERVELRVKREYDADGDQLTRNWFFSESNSTWINNLPFTNAWSTPYNKTRYTNILANTIGSHKVCAITTDDNGAESNKACAFLDVVGPEPIPVISGASTVKEGRPMNPKLDGNKSYSSVDGRTIDHSRDEWTNKQDVYDTPGTVNVTLHVFDNTGLKSLYPDNHLITVAPDDPPVIDFSYMSTMTRIARAFQNKSYSPDGDTIVQYKVSYGYDRYNNGSCNVYETPASYDNQPFTFNPDRVGTYCFRVYAKEDYNKSAFKDYNVEVINDNPEVTFTLIGATTEPAIVNVTNYNINDFVTGSWTNTSLDNPSISKGWKITPWGTLLSPRAYGQYDPITGGYPGSYATVHNMSQVSSGKPILNMESYYSVAAYLGNDVFLYGGYAGSSQYYKIASPNFDSKLMAQAAYLSPYLRNDLDELILFGGYTNSGYSSTTLTESYYKFKLSDLRNGTVSLIGQSIYGEVRWSPGYNCSCTTTSGSRLAFKDGTYPNQKRLFRFATDYKEIDLSTRTIKSYYSTNLSTAYKTDIYTSISAGNTNSLGNGYKGYNGNYYTSGNNDTVLVEWDSITGQPSVKRNFPYPNSTVVGINKDGTVLQLRYEIINYDDDGNQWGPSQYIYYFMVIETGATSGSFPSDYAPMVYGSTQLNDGWKVVEEDSRPTLYVSENKYLQGRNVYTFQTNDDQPPDKNENHTFGQLISSSSPRVTNGTIVFSMMIPEWRYDYMAAGLAFRIQDYMNMYRLEATRSKLRLVKILNGRKTVVKEVSRPASDGTISYKIKLTGSHIKVYENSALMIDADDTQFAHGTIGPFSQMESAEFKGIYILESGADSSENTPGVAIVDTEVMYETTYDDPEKDPSLDAGTKWTYYHMDTTKFLDSGDGKSGLSSLNGQTVRNPVLNFDKVGVYKVDYQVPDDPHPDHRLAWGDNTFGAYSKYSDLYSQNIIVHRRPISTFTLGKDSNNLITWTDYSYDPDHCYNVGNCQPEFATSHGIFKKKFYYISPSGQRVSGKLVRPTESGTYTVAMAVADEYSAWSDWYEQTTDVTIPVAPNNPPHVLLTFPNGTYASPSPVSFLPTINWNQSDPDPGTIFSTFDLIVQNEWGGCVECVTNKLMDTPNTSWAWTMDNTLTMGQKYQVQVRISDGEAWSGWSSTGWMATNSPPQAFMSFPYGTQVNPTVVNTLRPTLTWSQSDPDPGARFDYFQIQIMNEANNVTILDSRKVWEGTSAITGSWPVPTDLPAGQKLRVRVKVWDQYGAESDWSPEAWMIINRPPTADFDWTPKPAFEGDTVTLLNRSNDPDGDILSYYWQVSGPAYTAAVVYTSLDAWIPAEATDGHPGDYKVTLTVTDTHGASATVTRIVPIGDLTLQGDVKHTPQWEENRRTYNIWKTGDLDRPRVADMFWSGEAFVLESTTNQPALKVNVHMSDTDLRTALTSPAGNRTEWKGQQYRDDFERLPDATYTFRFSAVWPNGHQETVERIVTVRNPWTEFVSSVRKE